MSRKRHHKDDDHEQEQDQKQRQAELQAQLQGQAQGQAQGQGQLQFAVQDSKNENDNKNENSNENKNENKLDNDVKNEVKNGVDNDVENKVENKIENVVETKVDVEVDVKVDLDLSEYTQPLDNDTIDIEWIKDIDGSVVMPDVVHQSLTGNGNQINIDQVNNIVDKDFLWDPDVKFTGDGELKMDGKLEGGDSKIEDVKVEFGDHGVAGDTATATADALGTFEAFTQNIVMGANIQFNSIEMSVAGNDLSGDSL